MADQRYIELWVDNAIVGTSYDSRTALESNCSSKSSKYLYLSSTLGDGDRFVMRPERDTGMWGWCSFQFYDGTYKDSYLTISGGYLYVSSSYATLATRGLGSGGSGDTMQLDTPDGTPQWLRKGRSYQSADCGVYYYIETTSNPELRSTFQLKDFTP